MARTMKVTRLRSISHAAPSAGSSSLGRTAGAFHCLMHFVATSDPS
jgi:hypothetical protein